MTSNPKNLFAAVLVAAAAIGTSFAQVAPYRPRPAARNQFVTAQRVVSRLRLFLNLSR